MAVSRRMAASALLLLVLLAATEMGATDGGTCVSQSHSFRGACFSSSNCASVCRTEQFPDGDCKTRGLQRKCFCIKNC